MLSLINMGETFYVRQKWEKILIVDDQPDNIHLLMEILDHN